MAESNAALVGMNALVTGASSGLGPHICKALDAAGARVAIVYAVTVKVQKRSLSSVLTVPWCCRPTLLTRLAWMGFLLMRGMPLAN